MANWGGENIKCCVPLCLNYRSGKSRKAVGITWHTIPKDAVVRREWITQMKRGGRGPALKLTKRSRVCSVHFKTSDFQIFLLSSRKRVHLKRGAVPSIFPWSEEEKTITNGSQTVANETNLESLADDSESILLTLLQTTSDGSNSVERPPQPSKKTKLPRIIQRRQLRELQPKPSNETWFYITNLDEPSTTAAASCPPVQNIKQEPLEQDGVDLTPTNEPESILPDQDETSNRSYSIETVLPYQLVIPKLEEVDDPTTISPTTPPDFEETPTTISPTGFTMPHWGGENIKCCVPSCSNYRSGKTRKAVGISWHIIPKDETLRREWITQIRRDCLDPWLKLTKRSRVCSAHFKTSDFRTFLHSSRAELKRFAVPSIFPWSEEIPDFEKTQNPLPEDVETHTRAMQCLRKEDEYLSWRRDNRVTKTSKFLSRSVATQAGLNSGRTGRAVQCQIRPRSVDKSVQCSAKTRTARTSTDSHGAGVCRNSATQVNLQRSFLHFSSLPGCLNRAFEIVQGYPSLFAVVWPDRLVVVRRDLVDVPCAGEVPCKVIVNSDGTASTVTAFRTVRATFDARCEEKFRDELGKLSDEGRHVFCPGLDSWCADVESDLVASFKWPCERVQSPKCLEWYPACNNVPETTLVSGIARCLHCSELQRELRGRKVKPDSEGESQLLKLLHA